MLQGFLSVLRNTASNDALSTRRRFPRRESDRCVIVIGHQTFPVENWSFGGVLVNGDDRLFSQGLDVDITLKFKLRNTILDVTHRARVIRKGNQRIAFEFEPIGRTISRCFQQVVDDTVAREFANSQA